RVTAAIARRQELAADACAARRVGGDTHVAALRAARICGALFEAYWCEDVGPALNAGRRPPVREGFARYRDVPVSRELGERVLAASMAERRAPKFSSHPSLPQRIAAVDVFEAGAPDDSGPALELLEDPDAVEREILSGELGLTQLEPVAWDAIGQEVHL